MCRWIFLNGIRISYDFIYILAGQKVNDCYMRVGCECYLFRYSSKVAMKVFLG